MKRMMALLVALGATLLTGCATPAMQRMASDIHGAAAHASAQRSAMAEQSEAYFQEVDEVWLGGSTPIQIAKGEVLPEAMDTPVVYQTQYPVTLGMLAEWIGATTGLQVAVTADAIASAAEAAYDPRTRILRGDGQALARTQQEADAQKAGAGAFVLQYQGPLRGLLNEAAARTGNSWVWRNGRIVILNLDTRTFQLHALPGAATMTATVTNKGAVSDQQSGSGGGGGAGGSATAVKQDSDSGQSTTIDTKVDTYAGVAAAVQAMLSAKGKVVAGESTGTITVTDTTAVLDRVETYINATNHQLTRQVVIDVKVYSVDITRGDAYGINWDLVWKSVDGRFVAGGSLGGAAPPEGSSSIALGVLGGSPFADSKLLLNALSQQGDVSITTSAAVVTLSNQPVPVQVAEETSYLAQSQTNLVPNAGASSSRSAGKVVTGFAMNLLPVVLDQNEVLLQMQVNLSALRGIRQIGDDQGRIEVPNVDARQFLQRIKIASGATLVLGGFEQEQVKTNDQGIGSPRFTLLGGSRQGERKRTVMVIALTPRVVG